MISWIRYIPVILVLALSCSVSVSASELCEKEMPCCVDTERASLALAEFVSIDYGCMLNCEHPPGADEASDSGTWSYEFVPSIFDPDNFVLEPAPWPEVSLFDFESGESIPPPPEILPPESWPNPPPTSL